MNWVDHGSSIEVFPPEEFNFKECLVFLGRSDQEVLHQIREGTIYKLLKLDEELVLLKIGSTSHSIEVEFPIGTVSKAYREQVAAYIWDWFDLGQDLGDFYEVARKDEVLAEIANKYDGLRIIGIPNLFEALTWAIIGQQINLPFAYTLKKRFVMEFGESLTFNGNTYWLFPECEKIATIHPNDLKQLQLSSRKAEYIIGIAQSMASGQLTKEALRNQNYQQAHKFLIAIRGIGPWTADYVLMKSLHYPQAFPVADAGLHQALRIQLGIDRKPTIAEIEEVAKNWDGWQAYATFYLWRSLYE